jgi:hypothetical protein
VAEAVEVVTLEVVVLVATEHQAPFQYHPARITLLRLVLVVLVRQMETQMLLSREPKAQAPYFPQ